MYPLEGFAQLRELKKLDIIGLPDRLIWFKQCLWLCIQEQGGPLRKAERQKLPFDILVEEGKTPDCHQDHRVLCPEYDWKHYAQANGIAMPKYFEKAWDRFIEAPGKVALSCSYCRHRMMERLDVATHGDTAHN